MDYGLRDALFESGNDAPWEVDGIEFVESDRFVIHRAWREGYYVFKYDDVIVYDPADAASLIGWGMARPKLYSLCTAWEGSCIALSQRDAAIRDFTDGSMPIADRLYLVREGGAFYRVNRYWLLLNGLAEVADVNLYREVTVPRMSYKGDYTPWKEDGIFFIEHEGVQIKKGRAIGRYELVSARSTTNRTARELVREGYARPIEERKAYYFEQSCPDRATRSLVEEGTLEAAFVAAMPADAELIVEDDFRFESNWEIAVCYDCVRQGVVPAFKSDQLSVPSLSPELAQEYEAYAAAVGDLIARADGYLEEKTTLIDNVRTSLATIRTARDRVFGSAVFAYWYRRLSLENQKRFDLFYLRAIDEDENWEKLLPHVARLKGYNERILVTIDKVRRIIDGKWQSLMEAFDALTPPTGGTRAARTAQAEKVNAFRTHPFVGDVGYRDELANGQAALESNLVSLAPFEKEQEMLREYAKHCAKFKAYIAANQGTAKKSVLLKNSPHKELEMVRFDYRITRLTEGAHANVGGIRWDVQNCYILEIDGKQEIVFDALLVYLGLAIWK